MYLNFGQKYCLGFKLNTEINVFELIFQIVMFDLCLCRSVTLLYTMGGELVQMTAMNINYRDCCYTGNPGFTMPVILFVITGDKILNFGLNV